MAETPNITPLRRPDGSRPALREVMQNTANGLPRPDRADEALKERTADYIRRIWPQNTAKLLAAALGRNSTDGARAILEKRQAITSSDALRLSRHPGFGRRFILYIYDYPEEPDYSAVLEGIQKVRDALANV